MINMIPKIEFYYSIVYDNHWRNFAELRKLKTIEYPSPDKIKNRISNMNEFWNDNGEKILKEISNITGLEWKNDITCFMVGMCKPFSSPLTLDAWRDFNQTIDILVHELIHNIQTQNHEISKKIWWSLVEEKYGDVSRVTRNHIFVHAVHSIIYRKLFDEMRLKNDIERVNKEDYKKAWEIVQRDGAENIIEEFRNMLK